MSTNTPITPDVMTIPRKTVDGVLPNLIGIMRPDLANALAEIGTPPKQIKMRAGQIWQWIYVKGARRFDEMTTLSKDFRALLAKTSRSPVLKSSRNKCPRMAHANTCYASLAVTR